MTRPQIYFILLVLLFTACNTQKTEPTELDELAAYLSGSFSSKEQSETEKGYANVNLINIPIWPDKEGGIWLYSETLSGDNNDIIYLQRILHITKYDSISYRSVAYMLPHAKSFKHGWKDITVFDTLTEEDLTPREGCDVYYRKKTSSIFTGKTDDQTCLSHMKGVKYIINTTVLGANKITVWDRGYNKEGQQTWGKIEGPYKFLRTSAVEP